MVLKRACELQERMYLYGGAQLNVQLCPHYTEA